MSYKYGLITTKEGYDVPTSQVKDQVINSSYNSLKIFMRGKKSISVSAYTGSAGTGVGQVAIPHYLGYAPFYLVNFTLKHPTKRWLQDSLDTSMLLNNFIVGVAWSDSSFLYCRVTVNGDNLAAFTAVAHYQILIDKAFK